MRIGSQDKVQLKRELKPHKVPEKNVEEDLPPGSEPTWIELEVDLEAVQPPVSLEQRIQSSRPSPYTMVLHSLVTRPSKT